MSDKQRISELESELAEVREQLARYEDDTYITESVAREMGFVEEEDFTMFYVMGPVELVFYQPDILAEVKIRVNDSEGQVTLFHVQSKGQLLRLIDVLKGED